MGTNLILLGPPGSGKGSQADLFSVARGVPKISTGTILRDAVRLDMPPGQDVRTSIERGELVSDALVVELVRQRLALKDALNGCVLDGFPRTVAQASALEEMLARRSGVVVVELVVPESELLRRLGARFVCIKCGDGVRTTTSEGCSFQDVSACRRCGGALGRRKDDTYVVARGRLELYEELREPLMAFYRRRTTVYLVDGTNSPERVARDLEASVEDARKQ